jgi:hypothetical protein
MREMESKMIVYTVLAITLGYVFVSAIPAQLAPPLFETFQPEGESIRAPGPDKQPSGPDETLGQPGEEVEGDVSDLASSTTAAADAVKAAEETETAASGLTSYFPVFGTLIVNVTIAFAVYWLAKRRFA